MFRLFIAVLLGLAAIVFGLHVGPTIREWHFSGFNIDMEIRHVDNWLWPLFTDTVLKWLTVAVILILGFRYMLKGPVAAIKKDLGIKPPPAPKKPRRIELVDD